MVTNLLTAQQAAERLGVSFWTVYRMARGGQLASVRIGRRRLFAGEDLEQLVRLARQPANQVRAVSKSRKNRLVHESISQGS